MSTAVDTLSFTAVILSLAVILYSSEANANYNRENTMMIRVFMCPKKQPLKERTRLRPIQKNFRINS